MKRMTVSLLCFALVLLAPLLFFSLSNAFAAGFSGEIVEVDGTVSVTLKATGKTVAAKTGMKVAVGDVVETKDDGLVEILFLDGNVMVLDENTKLTITALTVNEDDNSRESIFSLAMGKIKSRVAKLAHKRSRFEVHTKSAVAGVRGTPDWVVGIVDNKTEVDLLGAKGKPGEIFVKGSDASGTEVLLTTGSRTVVSLGMAPKLPFDIVKDRLRMLQARMPVKTPEKKREKLRQKILKMIEKEPKEEQQEGDNALMTHLIRQVSVPPPVEEDGSDPEEDGSGANLSSNLGEHKERQINQGPHAVAGTTPDPAATTTSVNIKVTPITN